MVGGYLYFCLDDEIRRQVEQRLAEHYTGFQVEVGRARFEQDRGIAIYDVTLLQPQPDGAAQPVLSIDELFLSGSMRIEELVADQLRIDQIIVRRATLRAIRHASGDWNVQTLLPLPQLSEDLPSVQINDATLIVELAATGPPESRTLQGIDLTLTPLQAEAPAIASAAKRYRVAGTAAGLPARETRVEGEVGVSEADYDLTVDIAGLEITPELLTTLPSLRAPRLRGADVSGRADVALQLSRAAGEPSPNWSAQVKLERGRVSHPSLPGPLSELAFTAQADANRLKIDRLTCRLAQASVVLAGERSGWASNAPLALATRVTRLSLDERFRAILPESCIPIWQRFQPAGVVDAEIRLTFDGRQWRPQLVAECRDISLTDAEKFPYRLEQTAGRIEYSPARPDAADRLEIDLIGMGGGKSVRIEADLSHLHRPGPSDATLDSDVSAQSETAPRHPIGWVAVHGSDIPLHDELIAALPPKAESLVRSLRPQGVLDFEFRAEWNDLAQERADVTQNIRLKNCAVYYERFPYPLRQVEGLVTQRAGVWTLHDVHARGSNDSTAVICRGESSPRGKAFHVDLTFQATNMVLDDNLKMALPPAVRHAWDQLHPQGRVDFTVHAVSVPGQSEPRVDAVLQPRDRSVSLEPAEFPYRLEQVEGVATYNAGRVELRNVTARHDSAIYSAATGAWQRTSAGWQLQFNGFNADHLTAHRELVVALPPPLRQAIERLQPSGTFGIYDSSISFAGSEESDRMAAAWDIHLDCHRARLSGEMPIQSITGGIQFKGRHDGQSFYTAAELSLDSLIWKEVQITKVRGPMWIDSTNCLLGEPATQKQSKSPRRITADAYGGSLAANLEVDHDAQATYKLDFALADANLARYANERLNGPKDMNGTVSGRWLLAGSAASPQSMRGAGELHVVDANIYELPVLVAMLKVLKVHTPDTTAFNRCDMQFAIQDGQIQFKQLNLLGDAVSLYGTGESGFDRHVNLVFYTLPEPANLPIPLWKTIAGQLSKQALQLKVVGTWDNPEVQPQTLPAVNQVLEQIQSGAATMAPATAARDVITLPR